MMNRKIRIGVLGCASIAKRSVIPAIKKIPDKFELVCIASRTKQKAEEFSKEFSCKPIVGYENIFNENLDALYVPLPTGLHDEWINKALKKGLHVYAEKSIAKSYSEAQRMVKSAEEADVALMEGYMFQYHTQHQFVKNLVANGELGKIRGFRSSFGFPPLDKENFRYDDEIGGGVLHDAAGYPLRSVHFILGNDFEVTSATVFHDKKYGTEIYGSAFLTNSSGVGAQISFGFDNYYQCNYELWGSKGRIKVNRAFTPGSNFKPTILIEKEKEEQKIISLAACNHFEMAMLEFERIISSKENRSKHYNEIQLQSKNLDLIRKFGVV